MSHVETQKSPILLDFDTYRWLEHCGPNNDDNLNYRDDSEVQKWINNCPIKTFEENMINKKMISKNEIDVFLNELDIEIKESFDHAKSADFLPISSLYEDIYSI